MILEAFLVRVRRWVKKKLVVGVTVAIESAVGRRGISGGGGGRTDGGRSRRRGQVHVNGNG